MNRQQALRRVVFLKAAPDDALAELARAGDERKLWRGALLFAEHDPCPGLIVVLEGAVKLYKLDRRGREMTLGLEGPGGSVAELALFDGGNCPMSAEAAEENTIVYVVPRGAWSRIVAAHPILAQEALRALAIRTRKLIEMLKAQALHSVRARVAAYLLNASDGARTFPLAQTNESIGSQVGTVREVVSRTLHALADAGAITLDGRRVTVRGAHLLREIAGEESGTAG